MNIKFTLKLLFMITFLFLLFLNSGGIYHYYERDIGYPMIRVNKITGNFQKLNSNSIWEDINEKRD